MNNKFVLGNTDLASRRAAGELRRQVESVLVHQKAILDFSSVLSVSESYADELFGVLVEQHSLAWVFSRLDVLGARETVQHTIRAAIRYRLTNRIATDATGAAAIARGAVTARQRGYEAYAA